MICVLVEHDFQHIQLYTCQVTQCAWGKRQSPSENVVKIAFPKSHPHRPECAS